MTDARLDRLRSCYTSVLHDVMRAMGLRSFTLPPRLRPLNPEGVLAGPAFTIEGRIVEGADAHQTLLEWTGLLSKCPAGHVWVAQPNNQIVAQMGELSAETLQRKGVLGVVTDGALRDTNFILKLGLPCWGTHYTPRDVVGLWLPTSIGGTIRIEDVTVNPGDWVHGDRDGMVVIPAAHLDEVIEKGVTAMATESKVRRAILDGIDPQEAYLKYGKF
ncbi:RraA family protein [Tabrizicola sp.]|uniref:RraA family protein n=1 Tax=Tabrizicola sp. TaxID=2005166 RepID=UPI0035B4D4F3